MSDLVRNPEDRFSHNEAHIMSISNDITSITVSIQEVLCSQFLWSFFFYSNFRDYIFCFVVAIYYDNTSL